MDVYVSVKIAIKKLINDKKILLNYLNTISVCLDLKKKYLIIFFGILEINMLII
jgi:hypothetical protein